MITIIVDSQIMRSAFKKAPNVVKRHAMEAIEKSLFTIEGRAKVKSPIDTGILRGSIGIMKRGNIWGIVGTNVEYAKFQEFGTRFIAPPVEFMLGGAKQSKGAIKGFFDQASINIAKEIEK